MSQSSNMKSGAKKLRATIDGETIDVELQADGVATIDGETLTLAPDPRMPDRVRVTLADGAAVPVHVAADGDTIWTFVDGVVLTAQVERADRPRARARGVEDGTLSAPMPATVVKVLVQPAQAVHRGQSLLLLEAMKMELPVKAPRDGQVKAIHCQQGDLVQPGVSLIELE